MKLKLLKIGFHILTFFILIIASTLLFEYKVLANDFAGIKEKDINESFVPIFWSLIAAGVFVITTLVIILRDWINTKRLPFYIGMIALVILILSGITVLLFVN